MLITKSPYTRHQIERMQQQDGCVRAIISWHWDENLGRDNYIIDDYASELITGHSQGLENIKYTMVGCDIQTQEILLEVTGDAEHWLENFQDEEEDEEDEEEDED